jgi:hypothetical protein
MATARRLLPSASGVLYACAAGAQLAEAETEERARLDREAMGAERAARVVEQHERLAGAAPFVHDGLCHIMVALLPTADAGSSHLARKLSLRLRLLWPRLCWWS